jgi:hypothetical protein
MRPSHERAAESERQARDARAALARASRARSAAADTLHRLHVDPRVKPVVLQEQADPFPNPFEEPMPRSPFGRGAEEPTPAPLDARTPRPSLDDRAPGPLPDRDRDPFPPRTDDAPDGIDPLGPRPSTTAAPDPKEDCATALNRLKTDRINITRGRAILDLRPAEGGEVPYECTLGSERFALDTSRQWAETCYTWKASGLCHKPLYFEQPHMERYGHSWGPVLDPVLSGAHFFASVPLLPYHMGLEPPCECIYPLGHYRPGSCAPRYIEPWPWSLRAVAVEAATATGLVFALP